MALQQIEAPQESDHLQVETHLGKEDVSIKIDGKPVTFEGTVEATYKNIPKLQPTIRILDVEGKVRRTYHTNQLIEAHSPFVFACCCCCCCHTATTK